MLIAALCGMMSNCLGVLFNVAGLFFNPIADEFMIGRGDVSMAHTIATMGCALGGITGAWVAKRMKFRPIVLICTIVFAGATALLAFTHSIWPQYILSAFRGIAAGTAGTVLVTSPQDLVAMIVEKAARMAAMMKIPVLGCVENMSYFKCPDCGRTHRLFGDGRTAAIAQAHGIAATAALPVDPALAQAVDEGRVESYETDALDAVLDAVLAASPAEDAK